MNHRYSLAEFVTRYRSEFGDTPELADLLSATAVAPKDRPGLLRSDRSEGIATYGLLVSPLNNR